MTKGLDQYLQDAEQLCASEVNYFDDTVRPTNTSPMSEMEEQVNKTSPNNLPTAKQAFIDKIELAINILESGRHQPSFTMADTTKKHITARYQPGCKPAR